MLTCFIKNTFLYVLILYILTFITKKLIRQFQSIKKFYLLAKNNKIKLTVIISLRVTVIYNR